MGDRVLINFFDSQIAELLRMEGIKICDMDVVPWDDSMMRCRNCGCVSKIPNISAEIETENIRPKGYVDSPMFNYPLVHPQICQKCKSAIRTIYDFK